MSILDVKQVVVSLDDLVDDLTVMPVLKAPSEKWGGGLTLVSATYFAGTLTTSGTAHSLRLLLYNGGGTLAGTVADYIGGTASPFTTNSLNTFTLSTSQIPAGYFVYVQKDEVNSSDPTRSALILEYVHGEK